MYKIADNALVNQILLAQGAVNLTYCKWFASFLLNGMSMF